MPDEPTNTDPIERISESLAGALERVSQTINEGQEAQTEALRSLLDERLPKTPDPDDVTPGEPAESDEHPGRGPDPTDRMRDAYTAGLGGVRPYTRADFELAMMIVDGAKKLSRRPVELKMPEEFMNAARWHIFEHPDLPPPRVYDGGEYSKARAMDAQETGFGLELIGAQYATEMWNAARNRDNIVGSIPAVPMSQATRIVPIDGALPEMLFVSENTSASSSEYTTSKTASSNLTQTAKKFTIHQIWSAELEEDSVIDFVPFLRDKLNESATQHLGSALYNGDTTNAATGNINSDDADPDDTKHYLAWDGIRHYWLVTTTAQGKDMAAALDLAEINVARGKLNGADDDIDAAVGNINWGADPRALRLVMDWSTYMAMLDADKVTTVDKYGDNATVLTGELGNYAGIPIISPSYATKTEDDGKASTTETNNTKGQITLFNPRGFLQGVRREQQLFFDRIPGRDQFRFELYTRRAFNRWGANVASGIYDITV